MEEKQKISDEEVRNESGNARYAKAYSGKSLWKKIGRTLFKVGRNGIYSVLLLYYVLQKPEIPIAAKAIIIGALGYFISPLDLIPDPIPVIGYSDDLVALLFAVMRTGIYVDDGIREKAQKKCRKWFDDFYESDVDAEEE